MLTPPAGGTMHVNGRDGTTTTMRGDGPVREAAFAQHLAADRLSEREFMQMGVSE